MRQRERVTAIQGRSENFTVVSRTSAGEDRKTRAGAVVVATGYFGSPNKLGVPGEDLPHVTHLYKEGHEAFLQDVVVVGGGNSAAEAALDLWRSGARVTLVHFGPTFDKKIKPWVLPDFTNRVKEGLIATKWNSRVASIGASADTTGGVAVFAHIGGFVAGMVLVLIMGGMRPRASAPLPRDQWY